MDRSATTTGIYNSYYKKGIPQDFCDCLTGIKMSVIDLRKTSKSLSPNAKDARIQEIGIMAQGVLLDCSEMPIERAALVEESLLEALKGIKKVHKPQQPPRKPSGLDGAVSCYR